ncbi:IS3 family transposase [Insolitispirillum peregrinum]
MKDGKMGKATRKRYSADFKSKVALEALKGEQTLAELAAKYGIHQTMIAQWKRQAIEGMSATFSGRAEVATTADPAEIDRLHAKIGQLLVGQLLVERDFLRDASVRLGLIRGGK